MSEPQKPNQPDHRPDNHNHNHNLNLPKETSDLSGQKIRYPNPPDPVNPDAATLREQWRYATRQYSRWYSQAWGAAILAGVSFFALGWIIKGSNPLPSLSTHPSDHPSDHASSDSAAESRR